MNPNSPEWIHFDAATERLPVGLGGDGTSVPGPGLITFVVDPSVDSEWAAQASVSLAQQWVQGGSKVLLADLFLDDPVLSELLGVENGDGVADVFLYGASVRHVAKPVQPGGYLLATAGTAVADGAAVLSHERWGPVLDGFVEAGVMFLALVPAQASGLDSLLARPGAVVHLAAPDAPGVATANPVLACLGPEQAALPEVEADVKEEAEGAFSMGDLPASHSDSRADESGDAHGMFSMDALEGDQYDADASSEPETSDPDIGGGLELEGAGAEAPDLSGGLELEEPANAEGADLDFSGGLELESAETSDDEGAVFDMGSDSLELEDAPLLGEDSTDGGEPAEDAGMPQMEVESSMLTDDSSLDDLSSSGSMMEGIETGAGFDAGVEEDSGAFDVGAGLELEAPLGGDSLELEDTFEAEESSEEESGIDDPPVADADFGVVGDDEDDDESAPFLDVGAESAVAEETATTDEVAEVVDGSAEVEEPSESPETDSVPSGAGAKRVTTERKLSGLAQLEKAQKRKAFRRHVIIGATVLIVFGGGGYGLAFSGLIPIPGITPEARLRSGVTTPSELSGPMPTTPVMSHALLTQSYNDFQTAWELAGSLNTRLPDAMFFVAPVVQEERTRWGLFAGPAYSAVEAEALRQPVDDAFGNNFDASAWRPLEANYAFFFGEYDTTTDALARVDGLLGREIPSYVLQVEYPDGSSGYRVYGGAYGDEFQAVAMGEILRDSEITDIVLIERRGKRPE